MGKKSSPPAPDYTGAAQQQAAASQRITNMQTWANRPDQVTPFGSSTWDTHMMTDPATGQGVTKWTQNIALNPVTTESLAAQDRVGLARSRLAEQMTGRLQGELGQPMNWNMLPVAGQAVRAQSLGNPDALRQRAEDSIYASMTARLDPQWQQQQDALRTQLYNAGMRETDDRYAKIMQGFEQGRTDAYQQARNAAIQGGQAEAQNMLGLAGGIQSQQQAASMYQNQLRQQAIAEAMQQRGFTLNEINAALSGQQVAMPSMPSFAAANRSDTPNLFGAAQAQGQYNLDAFNARQMGTQGLISGLTGMAGTALGGPLGGAIGGAMFG